MARLTIKMCFFTLCIFCYTVNAFSSHTSTPDSKTNKIATFASGCFWCTQKDFDQIKGVISTTAGYTGGSEANPTYQEVSAGKTGHVEAVEIVYDPEKVSYEQLLNVYFHNVDFTDDQGQFCDRGKQYRPIIFYHGEEQKELAEAYKNRLAQSNRALPVKVAILPAGPFYPAEDYHQKYYQKNPVRYRFYRYTCGRDQRLKELRSESLF